MMLHRGPWGTSTLKRHLKSLAEQTLGVHISRSPDTGHNKHSDADLRAIRRWSDSDVVFDVGANDGRTILRIQELLNRPQIIAFEPVSSTYDVLVQRTRHLPNVRTVHAAVGARAGRRDIYLNEIAAMNSFLPDWTESRMGVETVDVITIDEYIAQAGIPFVHYLKVDTEGAELDVLQGAEDALRANRIGIIQVEVGFDQVAKGFLSLEQARIHLAARGYRLFGIYNQCRTHAPAPAGWPAGETHAGVEVLAYLDALFIGAAA